MSELKINKENANDSLIKRRASRVSLAILEQVNVFRRAHVRGGVKVLPEILSQVKITKINTTQKLIISL